MTCAYFVHKLGMCHKKQQQLNNIFLNPRRLHDKKRVLKSHYYPANI